MTDDYFRQLQERADEIIPILYDYARNLARRKYGWREGKSLPLGKSPEDIVTDVYVAYARGAAGSTKRTKGARHFDATKDMMLQLKGSIKSTLWALTDKSSARNERLATDEQSCESAEFASTDPSPDDLVASADFAKAAVERVKNHPALGKNSDLRDLLALFEMEIIDVGDQATELAKNAAEICQLRYQLRRTYSEVINDLNREKENR